MKPPLTSAHSMRWGLPHGAYWQAVVSHHGALGAGPPAQPPVGGGGAGRTRSRWMGMPMSLLYPFMGYPPR